MFLKLLTNTTSPLLECGSWQSNSRLWARGDSRCCSGVDCAAERASLCRHAGMYPCPQITWCPVGRSPGSPSPSCTTPPPCKYHHIITSRTPPHWLSLARNSPHFTRANTPRVFRRGLLQRTVCCESFMKFSQFSLENWTFLITKRSQCYFEIRLSKTW